MNKITTNIFIGKNLGRTLFSNHLYKLQSKIHLEAKIKPAKLLGSRIKKMPNTTESDSHGVI